MQKWPNTQKISILLFESFSNHCLANVVEPLRAANELSRQQLYSWEYLTMDGNPVASSAGMPILPNRALKDSTSNEFLFVQPSYGFEKLATPINLRAISAAARRFDCLVGLDTGSWLLASAGLLDGHRATIHWDCLVNFAETFPDVTTVDDRYVISGNRMSCGGAMTAFDLVCELIGRRHGENLRLDVLSLFMHNLSRQPHGVGWDTMDLVASAISTMRAHIETPLTIPEIANRVPTTRKKLEREFVRRLGNTPKNVYKNLRLSHARHLAEETDIAIAEIAIRCGYGNASAMTRAFAQEFGMTPRDCRMHRTSADVARFWSTKTASAN